MNYCCAETEKSYPCKHEKKSPEEEPCKSCDREKVDLNVRPSKWESIETKPVEPKPELTIYQSGAYHIHDGVITAKIKIMDENKNKAIEFTATGTDWKVIVEQQVKFFEWFAGKI
jgi:hypothetical protein